MRDLKLPAWTSSTPTPIWPTSNSPPIAPGVIERAAAAGVTSILAVGTTAASSRACLAIAKQHAGVWSSAGIHPNHAAEASRGDWDEIVRLAGDDRRSSPSAKRASTSTGKTRRSPCSRTISTGTSVCRSERACRWSFTCARRPPKSWRCCAKPGRRGPLRGVMHSFTGTASEAAEFLDLGLHISFAGMVTFKKSDDLRAVAATIPADRLLVETDSPYLSPEPFRGKRPNEPARVVHTAECLAKVRGVPLAEFARQTTANAQSLFRRPIAL